METIKIVRVQTMPDWSNPHIIVFFETTKNPAMGFRNNDTKNIMRDQKKKKSLLTRAISFSE